MLLFNLDIVQLSFLLTFIGYGASIQWLGIHKWTESQMDQIGRQSNAGLSRVGLTRRQVRLFRKYPGLSKVAYTTARTVVSTCQATFNNSRWNCSSIEELPEISMELKSGTKEQAYVYALASAQIALKVATACSKDSLGMCRCRQPPMPGPSGMYSNELFQTSGCSVNMRVGLKVSERFTDLAYKKYKRMINNGVSLPANNSAKEAVMNLHNSEIGRQAVKNALVTKCKCHGMSGSCEIKTCWHDLDNGKLLSDLLGMYRQAKPALTAAQVRKYRVSAFYTHNKRGAGGKILNVGSLIFNKAPDTLTFYSPSSDYCNRDVRRGSHGTHGRKCGDEFKHNCDSICCGRGFHRIIHTKTDNRCNCRHIWCCYVECDICKFDVIEHYCK